MIDLQHLPGSNLNESEVRVYRRHWLTLVPLMVSTVLVFILPIAGYIILRIIHAEWFESGIGTVLFIIGASIFFLFGLLFLFQTFMEYWLDIFIVTDKRILDINQTGLFNRTVSELRLYRTQDVTSEVKGIIQSMFNYGDVYVQTAGEMERFHFESVPNPNEVSKTILELAEEDRKNHLEETVEEFGMPDNGGKMNTEQLKKISKKIEP